MQITLGKALKLKNRQAQRVSELRGRIQSVNSHLLGSEPDFDAHALYGELKIETAKLWRLKNAINAANLPVHEAIYELAELKGLIAFLKVLNTQRGKAIVPYLAGEPAEYVAQISAPEVQSEIAALEARIDELQDRLDQHNATTTIEVDL